MDIISLIGETTEYDKKQAVEAKKPKSWCKSISAFANRRGGKLICGITDVCGIPQAAARYQSRQLKKYLTRIKSYRSTNM